MPEYLSPGVYVEEIDSGPRPIEGVGTACAAFIGFAPAGPTTPTLVTNWTQFVTTYGIEEDGGRRNPHMRFPSGMPAYLSHSVYGYFLNGGGRCYVTRVGADNANPSGNGRARGAQPPAALRAAQPLMLPSRAADETPTLRLLPKDANQTENIQVEVAPPTGDEPPEGSFTLRIKLGPNEEVHENVTFSRARGARNVVETLTRASNLVTVAEEQPASTLGLVERAPRVGTYTLQAPPPLPAAPPAERPDFSGDVAERTGVEGLEIAEDVTMVSCPDLMSAFQEGLIDADGVKGIQLAMIAHCERMQDRMAILDPLPDLNPQQVRNWRQVQTNYDSKFACVYYPWIKVSGDDGRPMALPPSGYVAGLWARNDNERGVHKAPANEVLRGVLEPVSGVTKGEQDTLNPIGVNCIRTFAGRGVRVWGARTLSSDPAWRYVNVRRIFNYVEKSIELGTQWVVFEPNDPDLWARVRRDVGAFLTGVWRDGMLFGLTPAQAFYVKCDEELNPPDVRDRGQLIIEIGLAPVKPAEFVIFRLSQWAGGGA